MSININSVTLGGRVSLPPKQNTLPSGSVLTQFTLVTNYVYTDARGQQRDDVCFIDCKTFLRYVGTQIMAFRVGDTVLVNGRLTLERWEDRNKQKRSKHSIMVESVSELTTKIPDVPAGEKAPPREGPEDNLPGYPGQGRRSEGREQENWNPPKDDAVNTPADDEDASFTEEDIPF